MLDAISAAPRSGRGAGGRSGCRRVSGRDCESVLSAPAPADALEPVPEKQTDLPAGYAADSLAILNRAAADGDKAVIVEPGRMPFAAPTSSSGGLWSARGDSKVEFIVLGPVRRGCREFESRLPLHSSVVELSGVWP